jgi:hypothetical protein
MFFLNCHFIKRTVKIKKACGRKINRKNVYRMKKARGRRFTHVVKIYEKQALHERRTLKIFVQYLPLVVFFINFPYLLSEAQ